LVVAVLEEATTLKRERVLILYLVASPQLAVASADVTRLSTLPALVVMVVRVVEVVMVAPHI
jgi:hypothetical protein